MFLSFSKPTVNYSAEQRHDIYFCNGYGEVINRGLNFLFSVLNIEIHNIHERIFSFIYEINLSQKTQGKVHFLNTMCLTIISHTVKNTGIKIHK